MEIKWLKKALENLNSEAEFIARDNPEAAKQIVLRINQVVMKLADNPSSGRVKNL
jgi:toxin ParE1/3/4